MSHVMAHALAITAKSNHFTCTLCSQSSTLTNIAMSNTNNKRSCISYTITIVAIKKTIKECVIRIKMFQKFHFSILRGTNNCSI